MAQPPTRLGDFEIVRELGRGGMGVVYEAVQTSLGRRVALKVLAGGLGLTPKAVDRFRREAAAAAKLHHTNVVPVYATGEQEGTHFYAMELIDGPSLDRVLKQLRPGAATTEPLPHGGQTIAYVEGPGPAAEAAGLSSSSLSSGAGYFDSVARMLAGVADALDYTHQQGVVHRDIKPANLLLSPDGRLSLNDFGLARMLEEPGMTMTGEFVGTPAYMSPEQITAGRAPLDRRTDIYSLGATLYELLTLRPPFTGERRDQVIAQIIHKEPRPPRAVNRKVPVDLETICLKAMDKDPDRRYQTAGALADDLRRYVNRFAISAKRTGPLEKLRKWAARNPALSAAGVLALLALGTAGFFAWRSLEAEQQFAAERQRAAIERGMTAALAADLPSAAKAVDEAEVLGASPGEIRLLRGFIAMHNGKPAESVEHLEQAVRLMPESVSARALLAVVLSDGPAAERVLEEAAALTPRTPEDKLFLGSAIAMFRPADGLQLMDEALAGRPLGIGHVLRAYARLNMAQDSGTIADADAALADAELVKRLMPDNQSGLGLAANSQLCVAAAYRRAGRMDQWDAHLAAAGREADALARYPDSQDAVQARVDVAIVRDGLAGQINLLEDLRRAQKTKKNFSLASEEAMNLFVLGRDEEAAKVAEEFPDERTNLFVRFLVALGRPEGREAAHQIANRLTAPDVPASYRLESAPLLVAAGSAEEFTGLARSLRADGKVLRVPALDAEYGLARLQYLEGSMTDTALLSRPAPTEVERARRHAAIAWKHLGQGDRAGAEAAFCAVYEGMSFTAARWVARGVIIRMKKDPTWPKWVAEKK
jgi:serine/threonine protein kinase